MIRPLTPDDVPAAQAVTYAALTDLAVRRGRAPHPVTDELVARGRARIAHLQRTDPGSAFVAEVDGVVVGLSMALVREGMWFLSLLMVEPAQQGTGLGKALLDAALATSTDRSWLLATDDPAAVRRYQRAGFALHPTYAAKGTVDRSALPAVTGIREAGEDDRATLDDVLAQVRGSQMGPEVDYLFELGARVVVSPGRGFALLRSEGPQWLAAVDVPTARALLWTALAETTGEVEVHWLGANQQWAVDVCLDARLSLGPGASVCLRGQPTMSPYLPNGAFG